MWEEPNLIIFTKLRSQIHPYQLRCPSETTIHFHLSLELGFPADFVRAILQSLQSVHRFFRQILLEGGFWHRASLEGRKTIFQHLDTSRGQHVDIYPHPDPKANPPFDRKYNFPTSFCDTPPTSSPVRCWPVFSPSFTRCPSSVPGSIGCAGCM